MAAAQHHVVVWDESHEFWEGALVEGDKTYALHARGVVTLPVEPHLPRASGIAGYVKRAWGAGWPLDFLVPRLACPVAMYCLRNKTCLSWAIRLVPSPTVLGRIQSDTFRPEGHLKLSGDGSQLGASQPHFSDSSEMISIKQLPRIDQYSGWTVTGECVLSVGQDAVYGFALYGLAPGLRVAWIALSQTSKELENASAR